MCSSVQVVSKRGFDGPPLLFVAMPGSVLVAMSRSVVDCLRRVRVLLCGSSCQCDSSCHMDDGAANTHDIFVDPTTVRLLGSPVLSNIFDCGQRSIAVMVAAMRGSPKDPFHPQLHRQ